MPAAREIEARTKAFVAAHPGWTLTVQPNGRRFAFTAPSDRTWDVDAARALLQKDAVAFGIDPNDKAVLDGVVNPQNHQLDFGRARWGRWELGSIAFGGSSGGGVYLGPLGAPPPELDDAALTKAFVGRTAQFTSSERAIALPCDPGPNRSGCPQGDPGPSPVRRTSVVLDAQSFTPLGRSVRGVQASPTTWELRVVARFAPKARMSPCRPPDNEGSHVRFECSVTVEVDGKPVGAGWIVDATSGEDLTGRALVF